MRTHPQMTEPVVGDVANHVIPQTMPGCDGSKSTVFKSIQSRISRSDPNGILRGVHIEALHKIARQPVAFPKLRRLSILQFAQTATKHPEPDHAVRLLRDTA